MMRVLLPEQTSTRSGIAYLKVMLWISNGRSKIVVVVEAILNGWRVDSNCN